MDNFWHGLISRNFPHDIHYFQAKPFCEVQIACCGPAPWHAVAGSEGRGTRVLLRWCCFFEMGPKRIRCDFLEPFYSGFWFLGLIFFPGIFEVYILRVYIYIHMYLRGGLLKPKANPRPLWKRAPLSCGWSDCFALRIWMCSSCVQEGTWRGWLNHRSGPSSDFWSSICKMSRIHGADIQPVTSFPKGPAQHPCRSGVCIPCCVAKWQSHHFFLMLCCWQNMLLFELPTCWNQNQEKPKMTIAWAPNTSHPHHSPPPKLPGPLFSVRPSRICSSQSASLVKWAAAI